MFGISAEVGVFPVLEAGEEMSGFVEDLGLLPDGGDQKDGWVLWAGGVESRA